MAGTTSADECSSGGLPRRRAPRVLLEVFEVFAKQITHTDRADGWAQAGAAQLAQLRRLALTCKEGHAAVSPLVLMEYELGAAVDDVDMRKLATATAGLANAVQDFGTPMSTGLVRHLRASLVLLQGSTMLVHGEVQRVAAAVAALTEQWVAAASGGATLDAALLLLTPALQVAAGLLLCVWRVAWAADKLRRVELADSIRAVTLELRNLLHGLLGKPPPFAARIESLAASLTLVERAARIDTDPKVRSPPCCTPRHATPCRCTRPTVYI